MLYRRLVLAFMVSLLAACGGGGGDPPTPIVVAPPVITGQPASQAVTAGQPATFAVGVQDATGVSYQWLRNGADIAGAASASYTLPLAQVGDSGSTWSVRVGNAGGAVTSNAATLTVTPAVVQVPLGVSLVAIVKGVSSLAVDPQGVVYAFGTTARYLPSGEAVARALLPGEGPFAQGVPATRSWVLPERDGGFVVATGTLAGGLNFVAPGGGTIARISPSGTRTVLGSWPASSATPHTPQAVAVDAGGTVYFADFFGHKLRKLGPDGSVTAIADLPQLVEIVSPWASALVVSPSGVAHLIGGNAVRKLDAQGQLGVVAGSPGSAGIVDGSGGQARFAGPGPAAFDAAGNLYVADQNTVRMVTADGVVTTIAGQAAVARNSTGPLPASFGYINALAVGADGLLYVTGYNSATADFSLLRMRLQ